MALPYALVFVLTLWVHQGQEKFENVPENNWESNGQNWSPKVRFQLMNCNFWQDRSKSHVSSSDWNRTRDYLKKGNKKYWDILLQSLNFPPFVILCTSFSTWDTHCKLELISRVSHQCDLPSHKPQSFIVSAPTEPNLSLQYGYTSPRINRVNPAVFKFSTYQRIDEGLLYFPVLSLCYGGIGI